MKIFVLDTSSKAASAAVWEDGHLLADCWQNTGRTHSVTSLPMAENLLADCSRTLEEMDALAVTAGPGSFTGLRIGMAMVKGMGFALGKPCIPLSTLEGLAWNLRSWPGLICPVMDARVGQVYTALFRWENGKMHRLMDDCAIAADELREHLAEYGAEPKILVGDGAMLCYNKFEGEPLHGAGSSAASAGRSHGRAGGITAGRGQDRFCRGTGAGLSAAAPG